MCIGIRGRYPRVWRHPAVQRGVRCVAGTGWMARGWRHRSRCGLLRCFCRVAASSPRPTVFFANRSHMRTAPGRVLKPICCDSHRTRSPRCLRPSERLLPRHGFGCHGCFMAPVTSFSPLLAPRRQGLQYFLLFGHLTYPGPSPLGPTATTPSIGRSTLFGVRNLWPV